MWKEKLESIRQEKKSYGEEINRGISKKELESFINEVKDKLDKTLPEGYIKTLKVINGIEFNGIILYGVDETLLKDAPNQPVNGLIENNEIWYENEWERPYLFLGDGDISWYVYDSETEKYYELDKPSGEICEEFSDFEQLLDNMLETALS